MATDPKKAEQKQSITIDGKSYDLDDLSKEVKQKLTSLRAADLEISRLEAQLAMFQTARNVYARAVQRDLGGDAEESKG
jgi:Family of unknown function (DUF6447)